MTEIVSSQLFQRQGASLSQIAVNLIVQKSAGWVQKCGLQNNFWRVDRCGALVACSLTAEITGEDLLCSKYFLSGAAVDGQLPPLRFMTVKGVDVLSRFYVHVAKWIKV